MTTCRDCGREVSRTAKTCPECGARNPATSVAVYNVAIVIATACALAMGSVVWYVMSGILSPLAQ